MPELPCRKNNKPGLKFGRKGACITGPGKKAKVASIRKAVKASEGRKGKSKARR